MAISMGISLRFRRMTAKPARAAIGASGRQLHRFEEFHARRQVPAPYR